LPTPFSAERLRAASHLLLRLSEPLQRFVHLALADVKPRRDFGEQLLERW